jgi:hypothetical protein
MSDYFLPRPLRGLVSIVTNSLVPMDDDLKELKKVFETLSFDIKTQDKSATSGEFNIQINKENLKDYNIFFLVVLSDLQGEFKVSTLNKKSFVDIGPVAQSFAENEQMLGYPKILLFDSSQKDVGVDQESLVISKAKIIKNEVQTNPNLIGSSKFFWDIFVAKIVSGRKGSSRFIKQLCQNIQRFHETKHFEEIFRQSIESSQPLDCQFLSHLRKKLYLTHSEN